MPAPKKPCTAQSVQGFAFCKGEYFYERSFLGHGCKKMPLAVKAFTTKWMQLWRRTGKQHRHRYTQASHTTLDICRWMQLLSGMTMRAGTAIKSSGCTLDTTRIFGSFRGTAGISAGEKEKPTSRFASAEAKRVRSRPPLGGAASQAGRDIPYKKSRRRDARRASLLF